MVDIKHRSECEEALKISKESPCLYCGYFNPYGETSICLLDLEDSEAKHEQKQNTNS